MTDNEQWFYAWCDNSGEVTISAPYDDFSDCYDDYVDAMSDKGASGHDLATFPWRGVFTGQEIVSNVSRQVL